MKILMIEDDKNTVEVIRLTLGVQDPNSVLTSKVKGREGLESVRSEPFDVVVLDLGLPDVDGINVLKEIRGFSRIPVLIVSARHDPEVISSALDLGAQDYILKPFNFSSLLSRLKDVTASVTDESNPVETITRDLSISSHDRNVIVKEHQVELTEKEWKILNMLLDYHGRLVPTKTLSDLLCEKGKVDESTVNMVIGSLRKKIGDDPYSPKIIVSEYDCGYRLLRTTVETSQHGHTQNLNA
jgi:two-component system, OmpR family, KDP operon response regulator KdpE